MTIVVPSVIRPTAIFPQASETWTYVKQALQLGLSPHLTSYLSFSIPLLYLSLFHFADFQWLSSSRLVKHTDLQRLSPHERLRESAFPRCILMVLPSAEGSLKTIDLMKRRTSCAQHIEERLVSHGITCGRNWKSRR